MSKNRQMYVREIEKFLRMADIERIEIYRDGSGNLWDSDGNDLASFDDTEMMFDAMAECVPASLSAEQRIIAKLYAGSEL